MKSWTFESLTGATTRVILEDEAHLIVNYKEGSSEAIEIDLKKRLIRIYDNDSWTILPMDKEQQFNSETRLIDHIDRL